MIGLRLMCLESCSWGLHTAKTEAKQAKEESKKGYTEVLKPKAHIIHHPCTKPEQQGKGPVLHRKGDAKSKGFDEKIFCGDGVTKHRLITLFEGFLHAE